jgi:hypothetical protein
MNIPQVPRITEKDIGRYSTLIPIINTLLEWAYKKGLEDATEISTDHK